VTDAELGELRARAGAAGLSVARYLVEAGLGEAVMTPAERAARERALFHLRKVGVNLNQLARRLNGGRAVPPAALEAALAATADAATQLGRGA